MSDHDRFVEFLKREAARHNAPPETPREAMWKAISSALPGDATTVAPGETVAHGGTVAPGGPVASGGDDELVAAAAGHNVPPVTPHDEMWRRIESAWELRRSVSVASREAGLDELEQLALEDRIDRAGLDRTGVERGRREPGWLRVAGAIGVAASLVIAFALGRSTAPLEPAAPVMATADPITEQTIGVEPTAGAEPSRIDGSGETPTDLGPTGQTAFGPGPNDLGPTAPVREERSIETLAVSTTPPGAALETRTLDAPTLGTQVEAVLDGTTPTRRNVAVRLATAKHLGQAETLLTSFRADESMDAATAPTELSRWARDLLGETRLLMDLPIERDRNERELLEELELILAQIARLGPDAPGFERDLISDGIARQGTIARLRAANPPGLSGAIGT